MILLAALLAASAPPANPSRVEADAAAVQRAAAAVAPHIDGTRLDGKPGTDRLVAAQWAAVQRWAADWLDAHPHAAPAALAQAGARFGDYWSLSAEALGDGEMLVTASYQAIGTAFILGAEGRGGTRVRWSMADRQAPLDAKGDRALGWWRPVVQNAPCRGDCRMIAGGSAGRLPNAASGAKRFWIQAYYAQEMGATVGGQASLWSWRNGHARPLLVRDYAMMVEQPGAALRGTTLHVRTKRFWDSLYACGSCAGRETDLRFAIAPGGVRALGAVSLTPELDLVDRVFARVLARRPAGAVASPAALRVIRAQLAGPLAETDPQLKGLSGMVMGWARWTTRGRRWACVSVDGAGATAFAFDRGRTRITEARVLQPEACAGEGTRM